MTNNAARSILAARLAALGASTFLALTMLGCGAKEPGPAGDQASRTEARNTTTPRKERSEPASSALTQNRGYRDSTGDDHVVVVARKGATTAAPATAAAQGAESDLGLVASCEDRHYVEGQDAQARGACDPVAGEHEREPAGSKQ